jgi:septal ring factor EnvC (AmiA/AmiB activator)
MSDVNEILKKVTASIEEATGKFNAKAEEALTEAKKNGKLSAETKETVDKMATEFNALKEAEKTLKLRWANWSSMLHRCRWQTQNRLLKLSASRLFLLKPLKFCRPASKGTSVFLFLSKLR